MPELTLQKALELALQHHRAGRAADAEAVYNQVLAREPGNLSALQLLARLYYETGRHPQAAQALRRAIAVQPGNAELHSNLGSVLGGLGRLDEAEAAIRQSLALRPGSADTYGNLGNIQLARGAADDAINSYRRALTLKPDNPDVVSNLGNALRHKGDMPGALECYQRAASLRPGFVEAQTNVAHALKHLGRADEAIEAYRQALRLKPSGADVHVNLANALQDEGRLDEAIEVYRKALSLRPEPSDAWYGIGNVLKKQGRIDDAIDAFGNAVRVRPDYADAYSNLGICLYEKGENEAAIAAYTQAITHNPNFAQAFNNRGIVLHAVDRVPEAIANFRTSLSIMPDYPEAYNNMGLALEEQGSVDDAIASYRQSLALRPGFAHALNNLANALSETGQLEEAIGIYRQTGAGEGPAWLGSNLLFALHAHPDLSPGQLWDEHARWAARHETPLTATRQPHTNDPKPERRIRVGYVSPDFNQHPVGRFLLPLFLNRDRANVEVYCYSDSRRSDWVTDKLRGCADAWRNTLGLSDERVAEMVREDRIDLLIDLAMHARDNRLPVFARKPAPVQATYLAYAGTTGLRAVDYRITDPYLDPPSDDADAYYSETSVRLPHTYWCYQPPAVVPDKPVGPPPAGQAGTITFGCLNNFSKVNPRVIAAWGRIMSAVTDSRMILHCREGGHRHRVRQLFAQAGVEPHRVRLVPRAPGADYFLLYDQIDIALDPFPYPGGTTTCDALWMGVPVVSFAGATAVSRGGFSILSNVGHPELVARDVEGYVRIATELASDRARLAGLRAALREQMRASPLMDAPRFARDFEAALRDMWRRWCARPGASASTPAGAR